MNIIEAKIVLLLAEFGNGHQDRSLFYGRCHLLLSTKIIHHQIADKKTLFAFLVSASDFVDYEINAP